MVSSKFKKMFEDLLAPRVKALASTGINPNIITFLGLVASFFSAISYLNWRSNNLLLIVAAIFILISGFLDAIDGVLARLSDKVTPFGGFLDSISDRYSDALVLSSVLISGLCDPSWGLASIIGSIMVSYARARAEAAGVKMTAVGIAERAERMILLSVASFSSFYRLEVLNWGIMLLAVLSHITVLQRFIHFLREKNSIIA